MKKFFVIFIVVLAVCISNYTFAVANEYFISEDVFNYVLFDYNYLTNTDNFEARQYFEIINNNEIRWEEYNFNSNINMMENIDEKIIYIQENYNNLTEKMDSETKKMFDIYILKEALIYYSEILGKDYRYDNSHNDLVTYQSDVCSINDSTKVAAIMLYSDDTKTAYGSSGLEVDLGSHAWIAVSNMTETSIFVGSLEVPAFKTVTVGTWGNKQENTGIWYNLEGGYYSYPETTKHMTQLITASQLKTLNEEINKESNDTWSHLNNCSSFASKMWNLNADYTVSAGIINTPKTLAENMLAKGAITGKPVTTSLPIYYGGRVPMLSNYFN